MEQGTQEDIEDRLERAWRAHRRVHAEATQAVRQASRTVTDEIAAAHRAGMSPEQVAAILEIGIGAVRHRLADAERASQE